MTRKTKALSGASQDAYFRRVLKTYPGVSEEARERIVRQLRREIAQLRVRPAAREEAREALEEGARTAPSPAHPPPMAARETAPAPGAGSAFDPFAVNVVVLLRTRGRAAAIEALNAIGDAENLKTLAREQQLGVGTGLSSTADLSAAIVAAAERRIANRRAAAGTR